MRRSCGLRGTPRWELQIDRIHNSKNDWLPTTCVELFVLLTLLAHVLLAMGVGAHAEVTGRRHWRWAPIVLVTGVLGVAWYFLSNPPEEPAESPLTAADVPEDALDRRPREKRLADPNTLHIDLPDGTTLTGTEQQAVSAVIERMRQEESDQKATAADARENPTGAGEDATPNPAPVESGAIGGAPTQPQRPSSDETQAPLPDDPPPTETLIDDVFEDERAGYRYPDVWWTDLIHPALAALPDVPVPADADEYELDLELRELYDERPGTYIEATDGERTGQFRIVDNRVEAVDSSVYADTSPRWAQYAKDEIVDRWEHRDWSPDGNERDRELEAARR